MSARRLVVARSPAALLVALAALVGGCNSRLAPLYCEGGVGDGGGGDCLSIHELDVDGDRAWVGTAVLKSRFQQTWRVRRTSRNGFELFAGATSIGTITKHGAWITLTVRDRAQSLELSSDPPSAFR